MRWTRANSDIPVKNLLLVGDVGNALSVPQPQSGRRSIVQFLNGESQYHTNRRDNTMPKFIIVSTLAVASVLTAAQAALAADHDIAFEACSPLNATDSYSWVDARGTRHTLAYACRPDTRNRQTWAVTSRN
jgi:hypothetical protein